MKTLFVCADKSDRLAIEEVIRSRGHDLISCSRYEKAWQQYESKNPTLILMAAQGDEAFQFSRRVRESERGHAVTMIAMLNLNDLEQLDEILDSGVDECIVESRHNIKRLNARLAFAERQAESRLRRVEAENRLRVSEAHARSILETTVDAIITINRKGIVTTFNMAAEKLFGYKASEVIGKNVHLLMPAPYKQEHDGYLQRYLQSGQRKIIGIGREVSGKRKDGSVFPMYLAVSEVKLHGEHIFTGIIRDITEQRRLEQEILRISEHERRRIGQDLHDGLGQMLTGIGLISQNLARRLKKEKNDLAVQAEEITKMIREADQQARGLARGLIPVEFDQKGLTAALERLVINARKLFNITCSFSETGSPKFEDTATVTHLFRIAQEAVSNAVKHGKASEVGIQLEGHDHIVRLSVEDNGTGFSKNWDKKQGLGVRIMQFRARLIGATLEISNKNSQGSVVTCTLLDMNRQNEPEPEHRI